MKSAGIINIIATISIWGAGISGYFYIKNDIPNQLTEASTISGNTDKQEKNAPVALKEVIHQSQKLVVKIELEDGSLGSGFLYNDKGDIITNAHVAANAEKVKVVTADSREFSGTVIGISDKVDVAVIRVPDLAGTEPLKVAKNRKAELGDEVLALGSPLGLQNTVTTGIISGVDRDFDLEPFHYENAYQISAPIAPGNSGGPLIDSKTGEVLGINSAASNQGTIGFSIPIPNIISLAEGWSAAPMTTLPSISSETTTSTTEEETYSDEELAAYVINYYYESINYRDYVTAFSLLGSASQAGTTYETFRGGYLNTTSVSVSNLITKKVGDKVKATLMLDAEESKDGTKVHSTYSLSYELGYENDQLKILSGNAEKVK